MQLHGPGKMNKGLTSFRALAFFAIFLCHIGRFDGGYIGILAFFVLSGFLLTPILADMKSSLSRKDFFIHFYGRRVLRIFPLYYAYLVIVASVSFIAISRYGYAEIIPMDRLQIILQMKRFNEQLPWTATYTYDFFYASEYFKFTPLATHFWSLAVEEQFYLVWPLAIFFIPPDYLKRFLLLVIAAGPLMRFLLKRAIDANMLPVGGLDTDLDIYVLPFSHLDAFAVGGYFSLYGKSRPGHLVWISILLVFALGMITSWLSGGQVHWSELGYGAYMYDSYKYVWGYSAVNLMFAYVLVHVRDKAFMPAFFENPLLVYLGTISYGLYVFHFPILWLVNELMHSYPALWQVNELMRSYPEIVRILISFSVTVMISMVSYEFMEKRFIKLKDKYF